MNSTETNACYVPNTPSRVSCPHACLSVCLWLAVCLWLSVPVSGCLSLRFRFATHTHTNSLSLLKIQIGICLTLLGLHVAAF